MSGDPEQDYFADGMVEEITTLLSRQRWLFVIARTSAFSYKGKMVDLKQVGRELGVRYLLEGSVRKAGDRVRVAAQLIDALSGAHLWADNFDGKIDDIFELHDRIAVEVSGAVEPNLRNAEIDRSLRKPTPNLDAYDLYLRASTVFRDPTPDNLRTALELTQRALERDPNFAQVLALRSNCIFHLAEKFGPDAASEALRLAHAALSRVERRFGSHSLCRPDYRHDRWQHRYCVVGVAAGPPYQPQRILSPEFTVDGCTAPQAIPGCH